MVNPTVFPKYDPGAPFSNIYIGSQNVYKIIIGEYHLLYKCSNNKIYRCKDGKIYNLKY